MNGQNPVIYYTEPNESFSPDSPIQTERPASITTICVLGFVVLPMALLAIFWGMGQLGISPPSWLILVVGAIISLKLSFLVGMWNMRKWGAIGWSTLFLIDVVCMIKGVGTVSPTGLFLSLLFNGTITVVGLSQISKMR